MHNESVADKITPHEPPKDLRHRWILHQPSALLRTPTSRLPHRGENRRARARHQARQARAIVQAAHTRTKASRALRSDRTRSRLPRCHANTGEAGAVARRTISAHGTNVRHRSPCENQTKGKNARTRTQHGQVAETVAPKKVAFQYALDVAKYRL